MASPHGQNEKRRSCETEAATETFTGSTKDKAETERDCGTAGAIWRNSGREEKLKKHPNAEEILLGSSLIWSKLGLGIGIAKPKMRLQKQSKNPRSLEDHETPGTFLHPEGPGRPSQSVRGFFAKSNCSKRSICVCNCSAMWLVS